MTMIPSIVIRNRTPDDAVRRVDAARLGCVVDATLPYLRALRDELVGWQRSLEDRIRRMEREGTPEPLSMADVVEGGSGLDPYRPKGLCSEDE